MTLKIETLPYRRDTTVLFATMAAEPWSLYLDSVGTGIDVMACMPRLQLLSMAGEHRLTDAAGQLMDQDSDPFALLRRALQQTGEESMVESHFPGGALGYLGYDLGRCTESIKPRLPVELGLPEAAVGIYDWALVTDHPARRCQLLVRNAALPDALRQRLYQAAELPDDVTPEPAPLHSSYRPFQPEMSPAHYRQSFARIHRHIYDGDCYQANLAVRFYCACDAEPWALYTRLRQLHPAPHSAFMRLPTGAVLCCSPERFLRVQGRQVETCPIKGTRPRSTDPVQDQNMAQELQHSHKDQAENLMIVDLLRNDLGKNCRPGSITVPALYELQSFATVHHLVSRITGELAPDRDALDLLRGCFPGGSVTGAPKRRAMQIIEALETCRRNVYCGSFIRLGYNGELDSNIAIRTLVQEDGRLYLWAGSGLVADSTPEAEYREILDKAAAFLSMFATTPA